MSVDSLITWIIAIDILGKLSFSVGLIVFLLGSFIGCRMLYNFFEDENLTYRFLVIWFIGLFFLWSLIPTKNTLYSVIAIKAGDQAIQELSKSEYTAKFKKILDAKLDEYLSETQPKSSTVQ